MTVKQLAERMGVAVNQLEVELRTPCSNCKKTGGSEEPAKSGCTDCEARVTVKAKN